MIKVKQPKKFWVDQGTEFKGSFKNLCEKTGIDHYTIHSEKSRLLWSQMPEHRKTQSIDTSKTNGNTRK